MTQKQLALLQQLGLNPTHVFSRGEASDLIGHLLKARQAR